MDSCLIWDSRIHPGWPRGRQAPYPLYFWSLPLSLILNYLDSNDNGIGGKEEVCVLTGTFMVYVVNGLDINEVSQGCGDCLGFI